ncbi:major facilitator superfamily domain-containing protein [Coniella lustricola]|uniref:Major facilitator superfamily domain-containing protein n=1 Tax=Coniella lustricola TaxID=2025994 RepID=A0A2T3AGA1_9PEZI|nr:major facilitator superfamily domain-containing protein [Coniella lustricola]
MAFDHNNAEDSCVKNHSGTDNPRCCSAATDDIEKLQSLDHEPDHHGHVFKEKHAADQDGHQHDKSDDGANLTVRSSRSTINNNDNDEDDATQLPERAVSRRISRRLSAGSVLTFPEGGLDGWLAVAGSFCAMLSIYGLINSSAVFESYFSENQLKDYSSSQIGWVFSLYLFCVFFVGIYIGPIFDRHGPSWLVPTGSLCMVLSLMLLGFCTEYYQIILTYSILGGLAGALLNSPAYATIAHHFNTRRGFATGIASTAGGIGGIIFPIMLQKLLPQLGFAWTTRILGFIMLALAVPYNLWIKARLPPRRDSKLSTSSSSSDDKVAAQSGRGGRLRSWWAICLNALPKFDVFRNPRFALAAAGIFFMEWGLFIPLTFIVSYAAAKGGNNATSSYTLLSYLNAGSVLGRFLPGALADRLGRFNVIILTITLCCATVLGLWLPAGASEPMLIAFTVIFGFASGSNLGLIPVCLGQLCDARDYGRYITTANFLASFGTLSSTPIGGALVGIGGDDGWRAVILFSGLSYAIALVCYTSARVLAVGWSPRVVY